MPVRVPPSPSFLIYAASEEDEAALLLFGDTAALETLDEEDADERAPDVLPVPADDTWPCSETVLEELETLDADEEEPSSIGMRIAPLPSSKMSPLCVAVSEDEELADDPEPEDRLVPVALSVISAPLPVSFAATDDAEDEDWSSSIPVADCAKALCCQRRDVT